MENQLDDAQQDATPKSKKNQFHKTNVSTTEEFTLWNMKLRTPIGVSVGRIASTFKLDAL
jgi:hypothetical protein